MEMSEFLNGVSEETPKTEELDVQKAVVESLAADKAEQEERIASLQSENSSLRAKIESLMSTVNELKESLGKVGDLLAKNAETTSSNAIALLDRDPELNDRFPGETRDHVLEVIREARDTAERDGRIRCAQLLEGVLVANEPIGNLAKKRAAIEKFFADNANVLSGIVIAELEKCGISYKNGESYLLPKEIINRTY